MSNYYLCPAVHKAWFVPGGNSPAAGGQLFTYVAGSSTKQTVYKDGAGAAAHTNPIVLDSGGNLPSGAEVWIPTGVTIDVVFAPADDTDPPASPYYTLDDLAGINDVNAAASEWVTGPAPTFVNSTQFVLQGDQSGTFKNGRRLKSTNTGGTVYSRITSVSAASGSTTVNVVSDSGNSLDSGLSAVEYGLLDPDLASITEYHVNKDGGNVASAGNGTTNIWGIGGNYAHITGTNTIRSFSSASYAGARRSVIFDGALTLQTSAAFLAAPLGNITTEAGDRAEILASTTAHSIITQYTRASGRALVAGSGSTGIFINSSHVSISSASQAQMESASTTLWPVTPSVQHHHPLHPKAWGKIDSNAVLVAGEGISSVVDVGVGTVRPVWETPFSGVHYGLVPGYEAASSATVQAIKIFIDNGSAPNVTSAVIQVVRTEDTTNALIDPNYFYIAAYGDH